MTSPRAGTDSERAVADTEALVERLDFWSRRALERQWAENWSEGAIFPCELAFFLAKCDLASITRIVESGRYRGFSTEVFAQYGRETGAAVVSIDREQRRDATRECKQRLAKYENVTLIKGEALEQLGRSLFTDRSPTAVIIDGPKGYNALRLGVACAALPWVRIYAQHNLTPRDVVKRRLFTSRFPGNSFYEEIDVSAAPFFVRLRDHETEICRSRNARRSLSESSLGVGTVAARHPWRYLTCFRPEFRLWQPLVAYLSWWIRYSQHAPQ